MTVVDSKDFREHNQTITNAAQIALPHCRILGVHTTGHIDYELAKNQSVRQTPPAKLLGL